MEEEHGNLFGSSDEDADADDGPVYLDDGSDFSSDSDDSADAVPPSQYGVIYTVMPTLISDE